MPITQGQGQSIDTEWKERGIKAALIVNLRIFKNKFGDKSYATYQHFDLNSGSGVNEDFGCIGSPLAFMSAIEQEGLSNFSAYFVDIDRNAIDSLMKRPGMSHPACTHIHGDNASFISAIPKLVSLNDRPDMAIGTVLIDPNGTDVPIDELAWLSRECPRLDFIINWNSVAVKRCGGRKRGLNELIDAIDKRFWLIRKPVGKWQWTLLIGRNTKVGDYQSMGFYDLEGPVGRDIYEKCNYTKSQYQKKREKPQLKLL